MQEVYNKVFASRLVLVFMLVFSALQEKAVAQTELQAWGNITGIRVQGELMGFESSIRVVGTPWTSLAATAREHQRPGFSRDSNGRQVVVTRLGDIAITETVTDIGTGKAGVQISSVSERNSTSAGVFFCISLSLQDYREGTLSLDQGRKIPLSSLKPDSTGNLIRISAKELSVVAALRQFRIQCQEQGMVYIRPAAKNKEATIDIYLPLQTGEWKSGRSVEKTFTIEATGWVDKKDVHLEMDSLNPGRTFAGFGGNFRIQNLKTDPEVIDYCLSNLRVAWGRVEMPWRFWQPEKNTDPVAAAKAGHLDASVERAMLMAQKLQRQGIPVILTAWSGPNWAIVGKPVFSPQNGIWGNPLNPDSIQSIYKSIADYIQYLSDQYGVQVRFFSFNESDLGINVRQTGEQHAELIRGLGSYFLSRGLKTKMLLGDNSDATTYRFIEPAMQDTATHPYIGALSFHSWRGWETALLSQWAAASRQMNLPLIVGEGSIDAAAWSYPGILLEQTYTMEEINLYIRLMSICQPLSILQWQLTSDYSLLTGGGIFGKSGPLEPTQRFWNIRQLASTPEGLYYLPLRCDRPTVTCAALGNSVSGKYVLHIVNRGAERKVMVSGIPAAVRTFKIYSTGKTLHMQQTSTVSVHQGTVEFILPAECFTTLMAG